MVDPKLHLKPINRQLSLRYPHHPCVIHQNINLLMLLMYFLSKIINRLFAPKIQRQEVDFGILSDLLDLLHSIQTLLDIPSCDDDLTALGGKADGCLFANTSVASCDNCDLACEIACDFAVSATVVVFDKEDTGTDQGDSNHFSEGSFQHDDGKILNKVLKFMNPSIIIIVIK